MRATRLHMPGAAFSAIRSRSLTNRSSRPRFVAPPACLRYASTHSPPLAGRLNSGVRPLMSIEAFENILLEDTFVLSWHQSPNSLTFHVLASLLQSHPMATPPANGDWACYRPGIIQFNDTTSVTGLLPQDSVKPTKDPDGSVDYGCIDSLEATNPGQFRISGEFGIVTISANDVSLILGGAV